MILCAVYTEHTHKSPEFDGGGAIVPSVLGAAPLSLIYVLELNIKIFCAANYW